jgi:hypothetical protein
MKLIRRNTITGDHPTRDYPCAIDKPVSGQPAEIQWYKKVILDKPPHDPRTHRAIQAETGTWTTDRWNGHAHILIYEIGWELEQLSDEVIISNVTNALGNYLDTTCEVWERVKYDNEGSKYRFRLLEGDTLTEAEQARYAYLLLIDQWFIDCRNAAKNQIAALLADGTLPSFTFDEFPSA